MSYEVRNTDGTETSGQMINAQNLTVVSRDTKPNRNNKQGKFPYLNPKSHSIQSLPSVPPRKGSHRLPSIVVDIDVGLNDPNQDDDCAADHRINRPNALHTSTEDRRQMLMPSGDFSRKLSRTGERTIAWPERKVSTASSRVTGYSPPERRASRVEERKQSTYMYAAPSRRSSVLHSRKTSVFGGHYRFGVSCYQPALQTKYENTYRMQPLETETFDVSKVEKTLDGILRANMESYTYDPRSCALVYLIYL